MWKKILAEGLSLALAAGVCFSGNFTPYEVHGAEDTAVTAENEAVQEDREIEAQLAAEAEGEYGEEPTDFSWLEEIKAEEQAEWNEVPSEEIVQPTMEFSAEMFTSGGTEEAAEQTETVSFTEEEFQGEETLEVTEPGMGAAPEEALEVLPEDADKDYEMPENPGETENPGEAENPGETEHPGDTPDSGEGPDEFGDGEETEDLSQTTEVTLQVEEGEDITFPLNTLLYKVKPHATDERPYKVIIPPGNYQMTGTICTYSNIHLYAVGATIKKVSDQKQVMLRLGFSETSEGGYNGYRNVTIEGGTWDCNYESCANKEELGGFVGFRIGHATNVVIKNVTFLNNLRSHFLEFGGVKNAEVTGCRFSGYWTPYELGGQECIQIDVCKEHIFPGYLPYDGSVCENIVIRGNTFENVFAGVGSHSMMFNTPYKNITITGNTFRNLKKRAVWCLNYVDSSVTNNVMENVGGGVFVSSVYEKNTHKNEGQKTSASQNQYVQNVTVSGNKISVAPSCYIGGSFWRSFGIQVTGQKVTDWTYEIPLGNYLIRGVTVRNNQVTGPGNGIRLLLARGCTVTGNKITLSKPDKFANFGIYLGASRLNTVEKNQISGAANASIYLYNGGYSYNIASTGNKIINNTVKKGNSDGILLDSGCNSTSVSNNSISSNKKRGIAVLSSTGIILTGNQVTSNKSYGIYAYKASIKTEKKNVMQGNGTTYAIYMKKCKGNYNSIKNITASKIKKTSNKVTGKALGGKTITLKRNKTKLGSAKISKKGSYTIKMKKQKKGTKLTFTVTDKYQNSVIVQKKVV